MKKTDLLKVCEAMLTEILMGKRAAKMRAAAGRKRRRMEAAAQSAPKPQPAYKSATPNGDFSRK